MLLELRNTVKPSSSSLSNDVARLKKSLDSSLEDKIQLKEICRSLDLNERVISRKFKSEIACSPYEYLLTKRMNLAMLLLAYSDLKIGDIAEKLQFSDIYTFSHFFKKRKGISPKGYRNAPSNHPHEKH